FIIQGQLTNYNGVAPIYSTITVWTSAALRSPILPDRLMCSYMRGPALVPFSFGRCVGTPGRLWACLHIQDNNFRCQGMGREKTLIHNRDRHQCAGTVR